MQTRDYFNFCSEAYLKCRPCYSQDLFRWLAQITSNCELALDCGAGNGQAAYGLSYFFKKVIAIDSSPNQLNKVIERSNIDYLVMSAEKIDLEDNSIDLIVSASAAHWFDLEKFYGECKRLLKAEGKLVIFTYTWPIAREPLIDAILIKLKNNLAPFWSKASNYHLNKYQDLPFPFKIIETPCFEFEVSWTIEGLLEFFSTWACLREYEEKINPEFFNTMKSALLVHWQDNHAKKFLFPLHIKAGELF